MLCQVSVFAWSVFGFSTVFHLSACLFPYHYKFLITLILQINLETLLMCLILLLFFKCLGNFLKLFAVPYIFYIHTYLLGCLLELYLLTSLRKVNNFIKLSHPAHEHHVFHLFNPFLMSSIKILYLLHFLLDLFLKTGLILTSTLSNISFSHFILYIHI